MDNDDVLVGRVLTRREVLALLGGTALLAACEPARSLGTPTPTTPAGATTAATGTTHTGVTTVPSCIVRPALTEGPFFVDDKLDRSDIRSDPTNGSVRPGVPLVVTFAVSRVSGPACSALQGAIVDLWQCDALGAYSDVPGATAGQKFLRGFQTTDARGQARFTTIYPGWYPGRTVHLHFKVRAGREDFTSQLFFDDSLTDTVFQQPPYSQRPGRTTRNQNDGIFGQTRGQLTLHATRTADGYAATFDIGLASSR